MAIVYKLNSLGLYLKGMMITVGHHYDGMGVPDNSLNVDLKNILDNDKPFNYPTKSNYTNGYVDISVPVPFDLIAKFVTESTNIGETISYDEAYYILKGVIQGCHALMRFEILGAPAMELLEEYTGYDEYHPNDLPHSTFTTNGDQIQIMGMIAEPLFHHNIALIQAMKSIKAFSQVELGKNHDTNNVAPYKSSAILIGSPVSATDNIRGNEHGIQAAASEFIKNAEKTIHLIYSEGFQLLKKY